MQKEISLLNDQFSVEEANEILLNMYKNKIQFYKIKNLSSNVKFGYSDKEALNKIDDLNKSVDLLNEIIKKAKNSNGKIVIKSDLNISISA